MASPVSTPVPRPQVPRNATPDAVPSPRVLLEPAGDLVGPEPARGHDLEALLGLRLGCRPGSRTAARAAPGTAGCRTARAPRRGPTCRARSATPTSSGTSRTSSVSCRLRITLPRFSRSASPTLPLTVSTPATSASSDPNSRTHLAAVFSPTPGMPGRLSLGSPRSAAKSGYCAGVKPVLRDDLLRREPRQVAHPLRG